MGLVRHFVVEGQQDGHAGRFVTNTKCVRQAPIAANISTSVENAAQRIVESFAVVRAFVDFDVGEKTEQRATPVGARPGMGMIQAFVAGLWQALMEIANDL